ncbi:hypothetical protein [Kitasatospora sp. NPDC089509]|uniref:hypothetical protein n=1 Tax=Kitasatospora sp. NPDC089509 TaxID=3364079 RepID=UPI00381E3358
MDTEPDLLSLTILCPPPGDGWLEVRPIVSGRDLLADLALRSSASGGPRLVGSGSRRLLGRGGGPLYATATPHEVRLAATMCDERCCGALYVTVARDGEHIVWSNWRNPAQPGFALTEFRFAADQYEAEVRRAEGDRGWEWPAAVVAMLLEAELRGREDWLAQWECELEAVCAFRDEPDRIDVFLRHPPGRQETDLPQAQFMLTLPISADAPSTQAEHLAAQLTAGDPRATAELCGGYRPEELGYPWP